MTQPAKPRVTRSEDQWRQLLSPQQYQVLRQKGTEPPFSGQYHAFKGSGTYVCAACQTPLFSSRAKFDSGTGWPSFFEPVTPGAVAQQEDRSLFQVRQEVHCAACGGHLGHVFPDGPPPTGLRYCINSLALSFEAEQEEAP